MSEAEAPAGGGGTGAGTPIRGAAGRLRAAVRRPWPMLLALAYAVLLLALRPAAPFEWDEVQFQRALDDYDVPAHSPHPPGYPAYVGAAQAVRALVGDPLLALQTVGVLAAAAALLLVWRFGRRNGELAAAAAAAAVLAAVPTFSFHANVGLSDVPGAAAGVAAVAALAAAARDRRRLPPAAALAALAAGVRLALLPLMLPLAALVLWRAVRGREWRALAASAVAALVVTDLIWLPAMYASGPGFLEAWRTQSEYLQRVGVPQRLPVARLAWVLELWLVRPFGTPALAAALWVLVAAGGALWWRAGRRWLVAVSASAAGAYLLAGMFTLEAPVAVRYVLPAVPFLALIAGGVLAAPRGVARGAAGVAVAAWVVAAAAWVAPLQALRRQPSPVWQALAWIRDHHEAAETHVVYDGILEPHAHYVLRAAGFRLEKAAPATAYGPWTAPGKAVLVVAPRPVAGAEVAFSAKWESDELRRFTRNRYWEAAVTRAPHPGEPVFSPDLRVRGEDWELFGTAALCIGEGAAPHAVTIRAAGAPLKARRAGGAPLAVKPGAAAEAVLWPGPAGCLLLSGSAGVHTFLPPVRTAPLAAGSRPAEVTTTAVVPLVVRIAGGGTAGDWRSDVYVRNAGARPLAITARFLPAGRDNTTAPAEAFTLPGGRSLIVKDVLAATGLLRWGRAGALVLQADAGGPECVAGPCGITVFSRTYNVLAPRAGPRVGEGLPAIPGEHGLYPGGRATFNGVSHDDAVTGYVSVATWIPAAVRARIVLRDAAKREVAATELEVPPFGQVFAPFPGRASGGQLWVQLVKPPAKALFYPVVTQVDAATGEPTHLLAAPSPKTAPPEWLAAAPQPLAPAPAPAAARR
jgi:hypothetical protein